MKYASNILIALFALLMSLSAYGQSDIPDLIDKAKYSDELIPDGWKIIGVPLGDLNGDGVDDLVLAIQNTDKNNIRLNKKGLGYDTIDLNPRILAIYFRHEDNYYNKVLQLNDFIPLHDDPVMYDPFEALWITKKGVLEMSFRIWHSAWGRLDSIHLYKFRYQNNCFELIGYDSAETNRATGDLTEYSINFLTREMQIKKENISMDPDIEPDIESEEWRKFKLKHLKCLETFGKPFEWEFEGVRL